MREEDLKKLPQVIDRDDLFEALKSIGFGPEQWKDVSHIGIGPTEVTVTAYWADEQGGARISRPFSDTQLAVPEFTVTIPIVSEYPPSEFVACGTSDGHRGVCILERRHQGVHDFAAPNAWRTAAASADKERCADESPNGVECQEIFGHDGEHRNGETFWGTPHRER